MLPLLLLLLPLAARGQESIFRINEKLTTDPNFDHDFRELVGIQDRQTAEFAADLTRSSRQLDALRTCGESRAPETTEVDYLRLSDIAIYADIGHLSTYCTHERASLEKGDLDTCRHSSHSSPHTTLDKLIGVFAPNLTVVHVEQHTEEHFEDQAVRLAQRISEVPRAHELWKIIFILPNIQDGEAKEASQTAVTVMEAIKSIEEKLPTKTLVVVVRSSGKGIWKDASHAHSACSTMLERWSEYVRNNRNDTWEQIESIVSNNFHRPDFTVEFLPLLDRAALVQLPNSTDLSSLGYDCTHWSARGLTTFHEAIWNALLTKSHERSGEFRPKAHQLLCPDPHCPFVRTANNSARCWWNAVEPSTPSLAPQLIAMAILLVALTLCLCLVCFLCCRKRDVKGKKEKAFGSNFSSIRFIDDDAP